MCHVQESLLVEELWLFLLFFWCALGYSVAISEEEEETVSSIRNGAHNSVEYYSMILTTGEANDKETSENIRYVTVATSVSWLDLPYSCIIFRMTSIVSKRDGNSERTSTHEDKVNVQIYSKSMGRTTNDKKAKGQKQARDSKDKGASIDRTAYIKY